MASEEERRRRAAARQARYRERVRLHQGGDHAKCLPDAPCKRPAVTPPLAPPDMDGGVSGEGDGDAGEGVTRDVTAPPENPASRWPLPADLGPRGQRLWDEMAGLKLGPAHVLLLERACRKADRLDRMDAQLGRRDWYEVVEVPNTDGAVVQVVVDKLLSEIRQTEIALKLDVAELRHAGRPATASGAKPPGVGGGGSAEGGEPGGNRRGLAAIKGGLASGR